MFEDKDGELGLSKTAYHFIGGVMHSAEAMCAIIESGGEFVQANQRAADVVRRDMVAERRLPTPETIARI